MNVLFSLYHSFGCNSASHVDGLARELSDMGCDCVVAVPDKPDDAVRFAPFPYQVATFAQMLAQPHRFRNGRGPDVFHGWTPRESVRKFHDELARVVQFRTVIHLEDNERHIAQHALGRELYAKACHDALPFPYPDHLTHPVHLPEFFCRAHGATVLIDRLAEHVPDGLPQQTFWPAVDEDIWHPRPRNDALREQLGIGPDEVVLTYHGNMHASNHREVRSLYLAVALLNRQGIKSRLVRVGNDCVPLSPEYKKWTEEFTVSLGYVVHDQEVVDAVAMADVLVQPGTSDEFNDYRFPSKLPEFLAMGRPVVLPKTNIGLTTRHLVDAYVLEKADGPSICAAVQHLHSDAELRHRLSKGAREFSEKHFCWKKSAATVYHLYESCCRNRAARTPGNLTESAMSMFA